MADVKDYFRKHETECEVAFFRSAPDREVALDALIYAHVHERWQELQEMLARASDGVRQRYLEMTADEASAP
jgi:hypothetical protein